MSGHRYPEEPPPEPLPWWAAAVCDECMQPVDTIFKGTHGALCGPCHPEKLTSPRPGVYDLRRPEAATSCDDEAFELNPDDFGMTDCPF